MSYDLCFWRETKPPAEAPDEIYAKFCEVEEVDGIEWLSISRVKEAFAKEFPEITGAGEWSVEMDWEGADSYFQVHWPAGSKPRHTLAIFVICGWHLLESPETMNRIVDVGLRMGCGLYDPQVRTRFPQPE